MSILISADTTFIVQGITGREAVNLTRENLDYGAKIVGGVTPGRDQVSPRGNQPRFGWRVMEPTERSGRLGRGHIHLDLRR